MATTKGTHITNFDATPPTVVNGRAHGGNVKYYGDQYEFVDSANGDVGIMLRVPTDGVPVNIYFACDDLGTAGTLDIGLYKKDDDGTYSAVDADCFANNIDVNAAAVARTDYRFSVPDINTANQSFWEIAGLSARPSYGEMYLAVTSDTGTTADGTVLLQATVSV